MREIILDTETTGLDPKSGHRIIEIGMLEMRNKVLTGEKFHFYLNPERDVPQAAYMIHGISTDFLFDKPFFKDIVDDFLVFIEGTPLVIHNATFDMKFINHELSLIGRPSLDMANVIDTLPMARKKFPGAKASLDALCNRFKIDNSSRNFHGALLDAKLLSEVYIELMGGRQESFTLSLNNQLQDVLNANNKNTDDFNIVVLKPSDEELADHKMMIDSKISNPIWNKYYSKFR